MKGADSLVFNLQETLGKMELALGSINEAIVWTDIQGKILWCNSSFDLLVSMPHISILGQNLPDILTLQVDGQPATGDDYPLQALIHRAPLTALTYEFLQADEPIYLEVSGNSTTTGPTEKIFILTLRDVTDLTLSQKELKKANEHLESRVEERTEQLVELSDRYKNILLEAVDAIITINHEGLIESFNPAAEKIFGYSSHEVLGRNITLIMPSPHSQKHNQYIQKYLQTGIKNIIGIGREVTGVHRNGKTIPLYLAVSEVKTPKKRIFTGILRDITQQKKAEQDLRKAKDQAESANRAKSAFLANMSHEIRTPMNAVLGFSELLATLVTDDKQKQYLDSIRTAGKGLLTIINDILDLSKVEAGRLELHYDIVDLRLLFEEIKQLFTPNIEKKNLDFIIDIDPHLPPGILLDEIRLRQILINLVGNAIKFTDQGYVRLAADITPGENQVTGDIHLTVEDTGTGILPANQKIIFEAFEQLENDSRKLMKGTGLGLAITKRLVEMLNGQIALESKVGKGSIFTITLPDIAISDIKPDSPDLESEIDMTLLSFKPASLLIVDDVESNRELIKAILSDTEIDTHEAENGQKAMASIHSTTPDLVLLDLRMPVMDGYTMIKKMKTDDALKNIPVIGITASVSFQEKTKLDFSGFDGVLFKPVSKKDLLLELSRFLPYSIKKKTPEHISKEPSFEHPLPPPVQIQELLAALENDIYPDLKKFEGALEIDTVKAFADRLLHLAQNHSVQALHVYAKELLHAADHFQIDTLKELLKDFPEFIKGIKKEK